MELNEKEKTIVSLINSLSEVANDESSTQDAIDNIIGQIRQNTSANIRSETENAERIERPKSEFPDLDMANGIRDSITDEKLRMMEALRRSNPVPEMQATAHDMVQGQLFFTRIREVKAPCKAHPTDAGIDFFVPDLKAWTDEYKSMVRNYSKNPAEQDLVFIGVNGVEVAPGAHVAIPSGIKTIIPPGLAMMMVNKSGVATKLKLDHSACLIDSEYRDELIFCFFNNNQDRVVIEPGMKITQGLIVPVINLQLQEVLNCVYEDMGRETDRGGGFGSSGSH